MKFSGRVNTVTPVNHQEHRIPTGFDVEVWILYDFTANQTDLNILEFQSHWNTATYSLQHRPELADLFFKHSLAVVDGTVHDMTYTANVPFFTQTAQEVVVQLLRYMPHCGRHLSTAVTGNRANLGVQVVTL